MEKERMSSAEIAQRFELPEWYVRVSIEKYWLKPSSRSRKCELYDRDDCMEVFGGLARLRKGDRNVVFRLPKICSAYDLAEILHIRRGEAQRYVRRFSFAAVRIGGSNCIRMSDDIWREVLR